MATGLSGRQIRDGTVEDVDLSPDVQTRIRGGWFDLVSPISTAGIPSNQAPTPQNFGPAHTPQRKEYAFDVGDYVFLQPFHVNHDMQPGGKMLLHVHWSTNGTNTAVVRWELSIMRALGHNQSNFGLPIVRTIEQAAHGTAWRHMVTEVPELHALTLVEPDELLLVTLRRVSNGGTNNPNLVFGLSCDFHYERDRDATPNRAPNFYA